MSITSNITELQLAFHLRVLAARNAKRILEKEVKIMMSASNRRIEHLRRMTRRPTPPGQVVAGLLEELSITQGEAAERLGVGRQTVNELLRSKRTLTPDMAHRLGKLFGNGPQLWLNMQQNLEMWDALHMDVSSYEGIKTLRTDEDLSEEISGHNLVNVN